MLPSLVKILGLKPVMQLLRGEVAGFLLSDDQKLLCPVLDRVKQLHTEYLKGVQTQDSERALRELYGLLNHSQVKSALDRLLGGTELDTALLNGQRTVGQRELDAEVVLAERFGFSSSQVLRYIERARSSPDVSGTSVTLRSSDDLQNLINHLHDYLRHLQANAPSGLLALWRHNRKLKGDVADVIFFIGVIIADGLQTAYFRLSYTVAIATFVRLVPNE